MPYLPRTRTAQAFALALAALLFGVLALLPRSAYPQVEPPLAPYRATVRMTGGDQFAIAGQPHDMTVFFESRAGLAIVESIVVEQSCSNESEFDATYRLNPPTTASEGFTLKFTSAMPSGSSQCVWDGHFVIAGQPYDIEPNFDYVAPPGTTMKLTCNVGDDEIAHCSGEIHFDPESGRVYDGRIVYEPVGFFPFAAASNVLLMEGKTYRAAQANLSANTSTTPHGDMPGWLYEIPLNAPFTYELGPLDLGHTNVTILIGTHIAGDENSGWAVVGAYGITVVNGKLVFLAYAAASKANTGPTPTAPPEPTPTDLPPVATARPTSPPEPTVTIKPTAPPEPTSNIPPATKPPIITPQP